MKSAVSVALWQDPALKLVGFVILGISTVFLLCGNNEAAPANASPPARADLEILDIRMNKGGSDDWFTHQLIVTIRNNGPDAAEGFKVYCNYNCPGGLVTSSGVLIDQRGAIQANRDFTYYTPFHNDCAGRPVFLFLKVVIDPGQRVLDPDMNNNTKLERVAVPH